MNAIKWDRVLYILLVIATLTSVICWFMGDQVFTLGFVADCIGTSVTVITVFSWFFCNVAWKWKMFRKWLVLVPNLNGSWRGKLISDWINPETNSKLAPIDATLSIKQSLFRTSCVMKTGESGSRSIASAFIIEPDNQICKLVYTYQNDPNQTIQDRSRIHYGTAMLDVNVTGQSIVLDGSYFTGRNTSGQMIFMYEAKGEKVDDNQETLQCYIA